MELPRQFRPPISQTAHRAISCITKWLSLKKPVYYTVIADTKKESKRNWYCITCGKCTRPSATLQSFNIIWVANYDSQVFQARKQTETKSVSPRTSSGRRWTGTPGVLQSMVSQRVRHDWATEQQQRGQKHSLFF